MIGCGVLDKVLCQYNRILERSSFIVCPLHNVRSYGRIEIEIAIVCNSRIRPELRIYLSIESLPLLLSLSFATYEIILNYVPLSSDENTCRINNKAKIKQQQPLSQVEGMHPESMSLFTNQMMENT